MNVFAGSLVCRAGGRAIPWIASVARSSWTGRCVLATAGGISKAFAGSRVFAGISAPAPLGEQQATVSLALLARATAWVRGTLGRADRAGASVWKGAAAGSSFARGRWSPVVGAGLVALGIGLLATGSARSGLRGTIAVASLIVGAALLVAGHRVVTASAAGSLVGRGIRGLRSVVEDTSLAPVPVGPEVRSARRFDRRDPIGALGIGVALALCAGFVAGVGGRAPTLAAAAFVLAVCLLALVLWRSETMLLVAAAFPWIDWVIRRALGDLGAAWDDAFLLLFVVLLVWCLLSRREWKLWTAPILLPTVLAVVAGVASVVARHVPGEVGVYALRLVFQPVLFYFLGYLLPKDKRWVKWTVALFLTAGVALALHGIYQYVTHAPIPAQWIDVREVGIGTRAYSIVENPNGLGAFLLIGALVSGGLALGRGLSGRQRWVMAAVCAIHLVGEAVTFSRGGWLGLVMGVLALLILAYRRYLVPLIAAGVVGWFVMPRAMINRLTFAFSSTYIAQSLAFGRLYIWGYALRSIAAHPLFGVGLGTLGGTSAVRFVYSHLWIDNFYLQLGAEGGLIVLGLFMWMLLAGARGIVQGYRRADDPYLKALAAGAFGAFVAVMAANLTASVLETLVVSVGFWFMAGLATSACFQLSGSRSQGAGR